MNAVDLAAEPAVVDRHPVTDAPIETFPPGHVIDGRYRIDDVSGRGGMAVVYRGHDLRLDRPVAIKVCDPCLDRQESTLREERASSALIHDHVVSIFDAGEVPVGEPGAGATFIVMEHVNGTTAQEIAPVPWRRAVELVRQAADGLAAAHARGIVHCDVKPSNLLIDRNGRVKLADFGVAAAASSEVGEIVHGSPAYMAPERLQGERPDPRMDVYALGAVLAYLMAGRHPEQDGLPQLPQACPPAIKALVARAHAHDPRARFSDAAAFREALDVALGEAPQVDSVVQASADEPTRAVPVGRRGEVTAQAPTTTNRRRIRPPASAAARQPSTRLKVDRSRSGGALPVTTLARQRVAVVAAAAAVVLLLIVGGGRLAGSVFDDAGPVPPAAAATAVPDVRGQTFGAAVQALAADGIRVDRVEIVYAPGTLNLVVDQLPAPGEDAPEDGVVLVVRTSK